MADREFRDLVEKMRAAQVRYFNTRNQHALLDAKLFELLVDKALVRGRPLFEKLDESGSGS